MSLVADETRGVWRCRHPRSVTYFKQSSIRLIKREADPYSLHAAAISFYAAQVKVTPSIFELEQQLLKIYCLQSLSTLHCIIPMPVCLRCLVSTKQHHHLPAAVPAKDKFPSTTTLCSAYLVVICTWGTNAVFRYTTPILPRNMCVCTPRKLLAKLQTLTPRTATSISPTYSLMLQPKTSVILDIVATHLLTTFRMFSTRKSAALPSY